MNRQTRRHPTHPSLEILYPSNKRIKDRAVKKFYSSAKDMKFKDARRSTRNI